MGKESESHEFISTFIHDNPNSDDQFNANNQMPIIDTENLVGRTYPIIDNNRNEEKNTIADP